MTYKNIDYCNSALKVLSAILDDGKKHFSYEEGKRTAGIYWKPIVQEMVIAIAISVASLAVAILSATVWK